MDLTVRGLVTIDGTGAAQGGSVAARGFDQVTELQRRASQASTDLRSTSAATQAQLTDMQRAASGFAGVKLGANDTQSLIKYGAALDQMRASYDPLFASSRRYEQQLLELDAIERAQPALASQITTERERLRVAFEAEAVAGQAVAAAHGQMSIQGMAAFHATRSMAEGLAQGIPVSQMLAMQLNHLSFAASGPGGITGAFGEVLGLVTKMITPTRAAVAVIGLVGAAAAVLYDQAISHSKDMEAAVAGPGRAAGVTAGQLDDLALSAAEAGRIGAGSAYTMAAAYVASGKLTGDQVRQLTALTADYAATTGQTMGDASKELEGAFGDIGSGIDQLDHKLGTITPAQREFVKNLAASGDNTRAVQVAIDAINGSSLVKHEDHLTLIGRLWETAKNRASDYWGLVERSAVPTTDDMLADARERLRRLQVGNVTSYSPTAGTVGGMGGAAAIQSTQDEVTQLEAQQRQERDKAAADARVNASKLLADVGKPVVQGALPGYDDQQALRNKYGAAQKLMLDPAAVKDTGLSLGQVAASWDALGHAIDTYLTPAQRATQETKLSVQALQAHTPEEKAASAMAQKRLELAGQAITEEEREAEITAAGTAARAAATYQLRLQNDAMDISIRASSDLAEAYAKGGAGTLEIQARAQAATEHLTNGVNIETRTRQLVTQAIGQQTASLEQQTLSQTRAAAATMDGNALVLSGAMSYGRLNDYVQQHVQLLQLEDLRIDAVNAKDTKAVALIDDMIAKLPQLTDAQRAAAAAQDVQSGMQSLSDNAPAAAQAAAYQLAIKQAILWRNETTAADKEVGDAHAQFADQVETIFEDRLGQIYENDLRRRRDWAAGIERANLDIVRSHEDMASKSEAFVAGFDRTAEDDFVHLATTGKANVGDLVDFVIEQMARMAYEKNLAGPVNEIGSAILNGIGSLLGVGGGIGGGGGALSMPSVNTTVDPSWAMASIPKFHSGGRADRPYDYTFIHPSYFDNAAIHHAGTGRPGSNELPIIVEKSEDIITRQQSNTIEAALDSRPMVFATGGNASGAPIVNIKLTNNTGVAAQATQGATTQNSDGSFDIEMLLDQVDHGLADRQRGDRSEFGREIGAGNGLTRRPR